MEGQLSKRLADIVNALPLANGIRVHRSPKAIQQAISSSQAELETGNLSYRQVAIAEFDLGSNEQRFDIAIAVRVGALDGRHPEIEKLSLLKIARALTNTGKLFIDGGNPLKERPLDEFRGLLSFLCISSFLYISFVN
ncbi:methyltransferase type 12 [Parapedobacter pyrenivorans]|uniref:Methyltransferase type 12 n=1 Tax=Parapedobacter pyrenivorans TaxID=1305674 RepID=A0A917M249_9SPHI|nr:SAM-dependent methyltransferase [Parapedobacter pyrenivorans]GGG72975.1 methyltransferase type 12 [Parapedobacter pyrenivorans]